MRRIACGFALVFATASLSVAAVNVEVSTPNASVRIGTPPPAPNVTIIERDRVIVREDRHEHERRKDNGKHKGHNKHKKHKKHHHND